MAPAARRRAIVSVGLLVLGLVLLGVGGQLRFDDDTGEGWRDAQPAWAVGAALAGWAGGWVATTGPRATQRIFGAVLLSGVLAVGVLGLEGLGVGVLGPVPNGFRFVWHAGETELLVVVVVLGLTAALYLLPARLPPRAGRLACYVGGTFLVAVVAAGAGSAHFRRTVCSDNSFGECDLGPVVSFEWAVGAAVVVFAWALAVEAVVAIRERNHTERHDPALDRTGETRHP